MSDSDDAELCKGSTTDSDSVCEGSNPSSAARFAPTGAFVFEVWLSLVERYVRDVEVAGSNPVTSTTAEGRRQKSRRPSFMLLF